MYVVSSHGWRGYGQEGKYGGRVRGDAQDAGKARAGCLRDGDGDGGREGAGPAIAFMLYWRSAPYEGKQRYGTASRRCEWECHALERRSME